jgi:hypothetical protein
MKPTKISRPLSKAESFGYISDYFHSGMSCVDYYSTHGISEWQFYKWKCLYLLEHPGKKNTDKKPVRNKPGLFRPVEVERPNNNVHYNGNKQA